MKMFKKNRPRYSIALIVSLGLHIFTIAYVYNSLSFKNLKPVNEKQLAQFDRSIKLDSIKFITQKQLKEIKDVHNKQIVANELNGKKENPKESRFAGEKDQSYDRQTIAATNGAFKAAGLGAKSASQNANEVKSIEVEKKKSNKFISSKPAMAKTLNLSDLGNFKISKIEDEEKIQAEMIKELNETHAKNLKKAATLGNAQGNPELAGLAQNNDFVEEVPLGDMTNLNTTEFKYYGFYSRIRQKLEQYWGNSIQSKAKGLYKAGRRIASSDNLITAVVVTLDDHGNIVEIKIEGTSGIRELDQAAIESFNKAGPFPNPPKGLLVGGRATIQWGFVVKS